MNRITWTLVALLGLLVSLAPAGEIGFVEDFALAKDRAKALEQLIPGTRDYYYYHCLHYQNLGQHDKVEEYLTKWIARYKRSGRVPEIEMREALLMYRQNPQKTLQFLRDRLGLHYNHRRVVPGQKPSLPTKLNQDAISWQTLSREAQRRYTGTLNGYEDTALDQLVGMQWDINRLRHLLGRLKRADYPNVVDLILTELNDQRSRGFGWAPVHRALLVEQLEELARRKEGLLNHGNFVNIYLTKLRPGEDTDWPNEPKVRQAYLERMWALAKRLAPVHNSLKANVLYHRLVHDRALGTYDRARFLTYLQLPRPVGYMRSEYVNSEDNRRYRVNMNASYQSYTGLGPIRSDDAIVRDYLAHFFLLGESTKPFEPYVDHTYLRRLMAETMILAGKGDPERWASDLTPTHYQYLKDRVDIEFAPTSRKFYRVGEDITLNVDVKNVPKLLVKVYQLNAINYYRAQGREVDTDINLDGLVANDSSEHTYDTPPLRRVRRPYKFPKIKTPGIYIVEFIGNGKSSRAVIRLGKLRYLARVSTAGHVIRVLDEQNKHIKDARVYLGGHEYKADKDGLITVPFSTQPGRKKIVLASGDLATLDTLDHQAEQYKLFARIHVDREALLDKQKARVIVRPTLYLNGRPVTLKVLEEVQLVITSVDRDGVRTTKEVADFKLEELKESSYEFQVPPRLRQLSFQLKAKVQQISQARKVPLAVSHTVALNGIDAGTEVLDVHLTSAKGAYRLDVLDKTGRGLGDRPVNIVLKHRDFKFTVHQTLQTNAAGRIDLGALKGIVRVQATVQNGPGHTWNLPQDACTLPPVIHGRAGQPIELAYVGKAKGNPADKFSLLEVRGNTYVKDVRQALHAGDGLIRIQDLPAGDYELFLKETLQTVRIKLTAAEAAYGYALGENRHLQLPLVRPLGVTDVSAGKDKITIRLTGANKGTRVHVIATRYMPAYPVWPGLGAMPIPVPSSASLGRRPSVYISGRDIGDEYRYILDRKSAKKYPGNMLDRPGLLLNPWAIRETETGRQHAAAGTAFGRAGAGKGASRRSGFFGAGGGRRGQDDFADLDFLDGPSVVLLNLKPDAKGVVVIDRKLLGTKQHVHVLAVDPLQAVYRQVELDEVQAKFKDLTLQIALDAQKHFTEQKQITVAARGKPFVLADITTSKSEVYDSLPRVYSLFMTLSGNSTLGEFHFVLTWPKLKDEEKLAKYSKYACHELHFFLYQKDRPFFDKVVKPYLANKKDKTFLDRYLLGEDLSEFMQPWSYAQLNTVERILLAQRIQGEAAHTARHVTDLYDLLPPNIERFNYLFRTALKSSALDTGDRLGLRTATAEAEENKLADLARKRPARPSEDRPAVAAAPPRTLAPTMPRPPAAKPGGATRGEAKREVAEKLKSMKKASESRGRNRRAAGKEMAKRDEGVLAGELAAVDKDIRFFSDDGKRRATVRRLYRKMPKTKEWVENNYYHLPIEQQNASLVQVNAFWKDYAAHDAKAPFLSKNLAECTRNFTEMMFALSVLDLPFEAPKHATKFEGPKMTLTPGGQVVIYHKEIKLAKPADKKVNILVSQNFFKYGERYTHVGNEKVDKYVTDEFLVHTVYGCHVVITNPTSSRQKLDVLLQIPMGAMPVQNGRETRSLHVDLQPYHTQTLEYYFFFPGKGDWPQFPVHVAKNEQLVAFAPAPTLHVVEKLTKIDKTSWDWISQNGTEDEVVEFLNTHNVHRHDLGRIAWRMKDKAFFRKILALLTQRHVYHDTLWSYGVVHNDVAAISQFLQHRSLPTGEYLVSPLLTVDPVVRKIYQHMEYSPLVNARAHQLGKRRKIVNERQFAQYNRLLKILTYKRDLSDVDRMAVVYHLLLQDRVEQGLATFDQVNPKNLAARIQYDYFQAVAAFYQSAPAKARAVAQRYAKYPVDRWRKIFENVLAQVDEIQGKAAKVADDENREQAQGQLAATEAAFDFTVEARKVNLTCQNVSSVRVNYYRMDIELLFSRSPFVQQYSDEFSYIRPNATAVVNVPKGKTKLTFDLPKEFHSTNVMVELVAAGQRKAKAYYANTLAVQMIETYGQVKVTNSETGKPLGKVYVKVYARLANGQVRFYKDGYTDLRGRFDYASLNTNDLDSAQKFSLLILSDEHGAVVREATPPKR